MRHWKVHTGWIVPLLAILLAGGILWAQTGSPPARKPYVIGAIQLTDVDASTFAGLKEELEELGYHEGRDIVYLNSGSAVTIDKLEPMIRRLLARKVDLLFVSSTPATLAAQRATRESGTPVVFAPVNDPVGSGIVKSLRNPGGNITGIRLPMGDDLRLQWFAKSIPRMRRILVPYNPSDASAVLSLDLISDAAGKLQLTLLPLPINGSAELSSMLNQLPSGIDAIFLPRDSTLESHIRDIVGAAQQRGLPVCAPSLSQVSAGALLSYGYMHHKIGHQAAGLVDQVLRGTPTADLPVETAENYLAVNLRVAHALGLGIPEDILAQADLILNE
ncbi:MAG: ABC transporter substrate-binding protein [Sulfuricella sp.]